MRTIKDGGPAFPSTEEHPSFDIPMHFHGMNLRDWFAGQVIGGMMASNYISDHAGMHKTDAELVGNLAARAYQYADAMITEREKGGAT